MDKTFYWFMVTAQWASEADDKGKSKTIKDKFMVKAVSPTDAETIVTKDFEGSNIEFRIIGMQELKITKILVPENVDLND